MRAEGLTAAAPPTPIRHEFVPQRTPSLRCVSGSRPRTTPRADGHEV